MTEKNSETIPPDQLLATLANTSEMQTASQEDYYQYMGQIYYLVKDERMDLIFNDPKLRVLYPMFSHLQRTSNIDRDKNGRIVSAMLKVRARRALRIQLMVCQNPKLVNQAKFDALVAYSEGVVEDMKEGWRGRLVTEKIKTYKIESGSGAGGQKSWLEKLFGR